MGWWPWGANKPEKSEPTAADHYEAALATASRTWFRNIRALGDPRIPREIRDKLNENNRKVAELIDKIERGE